MSDRTRRLLDVILVGLVVIGLGGCGDGERQVEVSPTAASGAGDHASPTTFDVRNDYPDDETCLTFGPAHARIAVAEDGTMWSGPDLDAPNAIRRGDDVYVRAEGHGDERWIHVPSEAQDPGVYRIASFTFPGQVAPWFLPSIGPNPVEIWDKQDQLDVEPGKTVQRLLDPDSPELGEMALTSDAEGRLVTVAYDPNGTQPDSPGLPSMLTMTADYGKAPRPPASPSDAMEMADLPADQVALTSAVGERCADHDPTYTACVQRLVDGATVRQWLDEEEFSQALFGVNVECEPA